MAKFKIPKKIGGVKIPKGLRKSKSVDTLLNSPVGRELLAGAMVAGAGAAATALAKYRPAREGMADAADALANTGAAAAEATQDVVHGAAAAVSKRDKAPPELRGSA